jgi:hypothetical protein
MPCKARSPFHGTPIVCFAGPSNGLGGQFGEIEHFGFVLLKNGQLAPSQSSTELITPWFEELSAML